MRLAVACGRHSHLCLPNDALVVDLSLLRDVHVDVAARTVDVGGGCLQQEVDAATREHGLAVTCGHAGSTGVGGLVLQGGHGYLERAFGLAIDNLLEVDVVLASGDMVTASAEEEADLFWAVRGGGGNFGVVTRFRFQLHAMPDLIYCGMRLHVPLGRAWFPDRHEIINSWSSLILDGPRQASGLLIMPVGGPIIESLLYVGDADEGRDFFAKHRATVGYPLRDTLKPQNYFDVMQKMAPDNAGAYYMSGVLLDDMTNETAEALSSVVQKVNGPGKHTSCAVLLLPMGGAVNEVDADATANPHRDSSFWVLIQGEWQGKPGTAEYDDARSRVVEWTRRVKAAVKDSTSGAYGVLGEVAQHAADGEDDDVGHFQAMMADRNVYGANLARLQAIKAVYDADNVFTVNDNIVPKAE